MGYLPTVHGVGDGSGGFVRRPEPFAKDAYVTWAGMLARCYKRERKDFYRYGAQGVFVSSRWLVFSNFLLDIQTMPGWFSKLEDWTRYHLDKDILGDGQEYSLAKCCWATIEENNAARYTKQHRIKHISGEEVVIGYPKPFYTERKINQGNFCAMLRGVVPSASGWRLVETTENA